MTTATWEEIVKEKREKRFASIPAEWRLSSEITDGIHAEAQSGVLDVPESCGILSAKDLDITGNHDAVALLAKMKAKELTSYDVTLAFCKRAAIAQQLVSLLVPYPAMRR
jgi:amidase